MSQMLYCYGANVIKQDAMYTDTVDIYGISNGLKFSTRIQVSYGEGITLEQAIIKYFGSKAPSFEELAIERGWAEAYWTYPSYN